MKKILLSVFTCMSLATFSFGQAFTPQSGDTSREVMSGADVHVYNNIINSSTSAATYDWNIVSNVFPSGWGFGGMCDNFNCYTSLVPTMHTTMQVNAGDTMAHYAIFEDNGAAVGSQAIIRTTIEATGTTPSNPRTLTFIATKGTTSTVTVTKTDDNIVVFPNPAKNVVNVIYNENMGVKNIGIYNIIGKMVSIYKVGNTSAKLDIDNLPSGIYFVRLLNNQGKVVGTRKFTHQ